MVEEPVVHLVEVLEEVEVEHMVVEDVAEQDINLVEEPVVHMEVATVVLGEEEALGGATTEVSMVVEMVVNTVVEEQHIGQDGMIILIGLKWELEVNMVVMED